LGKYLDLLLRVLAGKSDANISFTELRGLLLGLGFHERIKGDHHIFMKGGIEEILNLHPLGSKAKAYQVKQIRNVIVKYTLGGEDVE
jgi:hypothetical protein